MHPIERLRYVARSGEVDAGLLAQESADALGSLWRDPRALVPACRRLIEFHPTCAPLWWVCARLLGSSDVRDAADLASRMLYDDPTAAELAATFPAGATVVSDGGPTALMALGERPDVTTRLVGPPSRLRYAMRQIDGDVSGYDEVEADQACSEASLVLLEPLAAGPQGVLVDELGASLAAAAERSSLDLWVVVGEGRLLPAPLFGAIVEHLGVLPDRSTVDADLDRLMPSNSGSARRRSVVADTSVVPAAAITAVVGPTGAMHASVALGRATCPSPTELLEPSRGM